MNETAGWICGLLAVVAIVCGATYSCTKTSTVYRELAEKCISAGGSWIESSGGSYSGHCINVSHK